MKRILIRTGLGLLLVLMLFLGGAVWLLLFSARPPLTIDPATLAGDGSVLNYCELPLLDGSGKRAVDIPKGNTPGCSYDHFPLPVLRECTEPLPEGVADIRGLWLGVTGRVGHLERIEQCGARTVVTSSGVIHDSGPNSTGGYNTNDTEGVVLFSIGDRDYCPRTSAGMEWAEGVLDFHLLGWGPVVVSRYPEGEQLVWGYVDGSTTRMDRLCRLPEEHRIPIPRGPRFSLFTGD